MSEPKSQQRAERDWEKIELDYRAGIKTLRQIADEHDITHGAINKRAKKEAWDRDLSARIKAKAEAEVSKRAVSEEVSKKRLASEREVVDANAHAIVEVQIGQRKDIQRSRKIVMALLAELEQKTGAENVELLENLGGLLRNEDENGQDKLNDLYHKIISLPQRAKTLRDLGESLRVLVALERQAFGIDDKDGGGQAGNDRSMTDTERAVRLVRLMQSSSEMLSRLTSREDIP